MATCPRCGSDAEYLPGDNFSLLDCDFCGDTIDVTDLAGLDDADGPVRPLQAPALRPRRTHDLRVA
jgi:hypothetical protein